MSEVESAATQLKTQYAAQVAADLERNTKEQERIGAEVASLEEQLRGLRHDRTLLAQLQRALGGDDSAQAAATTAKRKKTATGPAATKSAAESGSSASAASKSVASKSAAAKPAAAKPALAKPAPARPTLVELIRDHLGRQSEPRSSAEVATALAEAHPDREIKPKVVRTTIEGLVAKGQVQRTKQGSSVFYTTAAAAAAPGDTAETTQVTETGTEQAPDTA